MASLGEGVETEGADEELSSWANQDCSSGSPAVGGADTADSVRAARVSADRTSRSGSSSFVGYPECSAIRLFGALLIAVERGLWANRGERRAAVCQLKSTGFTVLGALTKVPAPGRLSMSP